MNTHLAPTTSPSPLPTVGIIGGGQLAQMTAQAAISLSVTVAVFASDESDPACSAASWSMVGDLDNPSDAELLTEFARRCDVVTFDHERVAQDVVEALEATGVSVRPSSTVLQFSDKAYQRTRFAEANLPVPPFVAMFADEGLDHRVEPFGWPLVIKTAFGGYDGKGVFIVEDADKGQRLLERLCGRWVVIEPMLNIEAEIAVVVARRPSGEHAVYPVVGTLQRDGICVETVVPAPLSPELMDEASELAVQIAEMIDAVGIIAVEFFVTPSGLVINEIAPRPHNSGHWTIEGAVTSQFENHLRSVLDWPLGDTAATAPAIAMVNVLGGPEVAGPATFLPDALSVSEAHIHLYGKSVQSGRKLGHVTATGDDCDVALDRARRAARLLLGDAEHQNLPITRGAQT